MMKFLWLAASLSVLLSGCTPTEEQVRDIVREELNRTDERKMINAGKVIGPYSSAVRIGKMLFVSGQIGLSADLNALASESIETETRQALDNINAVLEMEGYDASDVVNATVYLKNMNDFARMNAVYAAFFPEGQYPARTTVEVSNLPRNANIEIAVIAYKN